MYMKHIFSITQSNKYTSYVCLLHQPAPSFLGTFDPMCQPSEPITVTQHLEAGILNHIPHSHPALTPQGMHFDT